MFGGLGNRGREHRIPEHRVADFFRSIIPPQCTESQITLADCGISTKAVYDTALRLQQEAAMLVVGK